MKNLLLSVSSLIMLVLMITSIFHYQDQKEMPYSPLSQPDAFRDNQESPNIAEQSQSQEEFQATNPDEKVTYTLQNDELNITFNKGKDWTTVPVEIDQLFSGEYNGNKQELIENSYILTENRAAFLYSEGESWDNQRILLLYSTDQGKTWEEILVTEPFSVMRFRKVEFLNENFGYIIISGGRTMSQESSHVFLTHNGGASWQETTNSGVTRLISDGGFVDESTGFLSFGTINPEEPDLYVTQDGGHTWNEATINIPAEYNLIFVQAETPVKEQDHLSILVNQGPNGDYKGGEVKGKFISIDNGQTWEFQMEVKPNEKE
ncbi:oxidoreductase [Oceanobacillus sp. Castelsardo]|uniref:WD40/YVTN/BNR-like repeat-containing protein n=1 Tax=Oceanobacillus sp. Castelsardo TaxID=1851204 RepID=UPI000838CDD2|nr:oxidoreductase [Oceanobacillus sp. Castelsardo]